jgi:energy-coupling factor transporter ATP-binding protein EcfA2
MSNNFRTDKYIHGIKYNWNITPNVEDNNFEPLVTKIIDSNESYFITGAAGCGKSTLINMLKQSIKDNVETCDTEEVVVKKETRAITNIKLLLHANSVRWGKQLIKLMLNSKLKNQN